MLKQHVFCLLEKDKHGDVLWTWAFPSVSQQHRELFLQKCCLSQESGRVEPFFYSQLNRQWYYMYTSQAQSTALPKVSHICLVLTSRDFHPEKYESLAAILCHQYMRTGNPASLLESYLTVVTRGRCTGEENGTFVEREYEQKQAYANGSVRDVVARFGIEVILLYTAMLLKRRIILYHSNTEELLAFARCLPALVWHRQNWSMLYPHVLQDSLEMSQITSLSHYVAGFTDASIENKSDLYDLFVNISTSEIITAPHAKEVLAMGKLHKDIATHIVQSAEDENKSNQQIIKDIALKTKELLNNLKSLSTVDQDGHPIIQLETLRERKMAATTENFLYNLAAAEGMVQGL